MNSIVKEIHIPINKHLNSLIVFESSIKEYRKYLKHYRGDPYKLYLTSIRIRWKKTYARWKQVLEDHQLQSSIIYQVLSIQALVKYLPHTDEVTSHLKLARFLESKKIMFASQLEEVFKQIKLLHKYISLFTKRLHSLSKHAANNPPDFKKNWRIFREVIAANSNFNDDFVFYKEPKRTVLPEEAESLLSKYSDEVFKMRSKYLTSRDEKYDIAIQPILVRKKKQKMEIITIEPLQKRKKRVIRRTVRKKPKKPEVKYPEINIRKSFTKKRTRERKNEKKIEENENNGFLSSRYTVDYRGNLIPESVHVFEEVEDPYIKISIPVDSILSSRFKNHQDHLLKRLLVEEKFNHGEIESYFEVEGTKLNRFKRDDFRI